MSVDLQSTGELTLDPEAQATCRVRAVLDPTGVELNIEMKYWYEDKPEEKHTAKTPFDIYIPVYIEAPAWSGSYEFKYWVDPDGAKHYENVIYADKEGEYIAHYEARLIPWELLSWLWWFLLLLLILFLLVSLFTGMIPEEEKE